MKVPLNWLKEFLELNVAPAQIATALTSLGLEVEAIDSVGPGFSKVVVGKVLASEKHPNADKLSIAQVTDGVETFQVVCGAPNCRAGIKTAFAMLGAEIGHGDDKIKIKKSKIRGVESFGMLLSGKELGISEDQEGIIEFQDRMKEGQDLADLYSNTVIEVGLTPNLSHCLSIEGVAKELKAAFNLKFKKREITLTEEGTALNFKVEVNDSEGCPRYSARVVEGLKVGPSPDWLKQKLESVGIRSINNLVDISNYVMMETGQPLHAFDLDLLKEKVIVRKSLKDEKLTTLDGKERVLEEGTLIIADVEKPIAVAGVMGGANSEVNENTTRVLIESAHFDPSTVRKGAKKLGLSTDASRRFERGVDPNLTVRALDLAASLMIQIAGGKVSRGLIDIKKEEFKPKTINLRINRVNGLLGTHLGQGEIESLLTRLDFKVIPKDANSVDVVSPTYRFDVKEEIDLVEEVARIYGYDNIPREPARFHDSELASAQSYIFETEVREKLIREGLQEFINCDLIGPTALKIVSGVEALEDRAIKVLNPVSVEQSSLRTSLLPGLLQTVKHNFDRESKSIAGFEIGRIHYKDEDKYKEPACVAIVLSGDSADSGYDPKPRNYDFRDLKGIIENFLTALGIQNASYRPSTLAALHPGRQASIFVNGLEIGSFGEIHPQVARRLDGPGRILFAELNLVDLFKSRKKDIRMKELSQFPAMERDWTLTLKEEAPVAQVLAAIKSIPSQLLEEVYLSDMYRSASLGSNIKNATFHFVYRDKNKTLEQETVDKEHARLIETALHLISGCLP
jgi:phenylalanyl-tRNA synthetase beta chain